VLFRSHLTYMLCFLLLNYINETVWLIFPTLFQVKQQKCLNYTVLSFKANQSCMPVIFFCDLLFCFYVVRTSPILYVQDKSVEML
jgi:hypothetical protein